MYGDASESGAGEWPSAIGRARERSCRGGCDYTRRVEPALWLSLVAATLVISITPGAGAINTMTNAMTVGWRRSVWGVIGQQLALVLHIAIVAAGVGVLVASSPVLFKAIRYLGAAYLVYLGLRLIFARAEPLASPEPPDDPGEGGSLPAQGRRATGAREAPLREESVSSIIRRGFWVNLLNPKSVVFFLAFLPQFIRPDMPLLPQYLVLIATVVGIDVVIMWGFFATVARPFRRLTATERGQRLLNGTFGTLFIGVAALLVFVH